MFNLKPQLHIPTLTILLGLSSINKMAFLHVLLTDAQILFKLKMIHDQAILSFLIVSSFNLLNIFLEAFTCPFLE